MSHNQIGDTIITWVGGNYNFVCKRVNQSNFQSEGCVWDNDGLYATCPKLIVNLHFANKAIRIQIIKISLSLLWLLNCYFLQSVGMYSSVTTHSISLSFSFYQGFHIRFITYFSDEFLFNITSHINTDFPKEHVSASIDTLFHVLAIFLSNKRIFLQLIIQIVSQSFGWAVGLIWIKGTWVNQLFVSWTGIPNQAHLQLQHEEPHLNL